MPMPKVSVIIPTYNCAKYLPEAIDSVLNQTYQDFEIIIVDDGSTDGTKRVIEEAISRQLSAINSQSSAESRKPTAIKYIYQQNKGPGAARNKGVLEARGEYIAFLDADDSWVPEKLAKQVELLDENSQAVLVFCDMTQKKGNKILYSRYLREKGHDLLCKKSNIFLELTKKIFIFTPTVLVKKNILLKIGLFNEKYRVGEDYDLWLRIAKTYKIDFINEALVIRQLHESSAISNRYLFYKEHIVLFNDFLKSNIFSEIEKRIIAKRILEFNYELGYYYFSDKKYKQSIKWFAKCVFSRNGLKAFFYFISALFPDELINFLRMVKRKQNIIICQK